MPRQLQHHDQTTPSTQPKISSQNTMDPFSAEGELVNIHLAYTQGQYSSVLTDFEPSAFSETNHLPVQILQYRAQCALGQYDEVLANISSSSPSSSNSTPDFDATKIYASYLQSPSDSLADDAAALAESEGDNLTVQLLCGTVLARAGRSEEALRLLSRHQGSLDAVALIVQIHLSQNRTDLAVKEAKSARGFAQDALLVNLAESWIGMRQVSSHRSFLDTTLFPHFAITRRLRIADPIGIIGR